MVAVRYGYEMPERPGTEVVLLHDKDRGVLVHALPHVFFKNDSVLPEIVRIKYATAAHCLSHYAARAASRLLLDLPEEFLD